MSNENRKLINVESYCFQITLHSYIKYSGLIPLIPVSNAVLHKFASLAAHYAVSQLNPLYSPSSTRHAVIYATH